MPHAGLQDAEDSKEPLEGLESEEGPISLRIVQLAAGHSRCRHESVVPKLGPGTLYSTVLEDLAQPGDCNTLDTHCLLALHRECKSGSSISIMLFIACFNVAQGGQGPAHKF